MLKSKREREGIKKKTTTTTKKGLLVVQQVKKYTNGRDVPKKEKKKFWREGPYIYYFKFVFEIYERKKLKDTNLAMRTYKKKTKSLTSNIHQKKKKTLPIM